MNRFVKAAAENVGGLKALAAQFGITHNAFYSWKEVPPSRVLDIERLSGISRHEIRPDIFGEAVE